LEDKPRGLSSRRIPLVTLHGSINGRGELSSPLRSFVVHELQPGSVAHLQATAYLTSKETTRAGQPYSHVLGWILGGKGGEEHTSSPEISRKAHGRDGDITNTGILNLARD
jgi:hypothetical protein